jgi:hypothetical protein
MQMFTGKAQSGAAGAIADTIKNKVSGSGAKAVAGGMEAAGEKATGAMEGALTKGGKTGGFLQRIANGVKKFGDTKVLKGAAAIALLGASVGLAAVGLRTFNEVNFSSLVKGTVALGGLALLAKTLGKGSLGMVMGAAAIASTIAFVMALLVWNGWELNIMESMCMSILAGIFIYVYCMTEYSSNSMIL